MLHLLLQAALYTQIAFLSVTLILVVLKPQNRNKENTMVILGSGGHTGEMLYILSILGLKKAQFVYASNDTFSKNRTEKTYPDSTYIQIPRARNVKQSYFTSIFSTLRAFLYAFKIILKHKPNMILSNGPGTALPLIFSGFILRFFNIIDCKIIFVESYCRISHISLTGKLILPFVDKFVVAWPDLRSKKVLYIELFPK